MNRILLTVDIDAVTPMLDELSIDEAPRYVEEIEQRMFGLEVGLPRILRAFREHDISATFFVPGLIAEKFPEIVRDIYTDGHEVAAHGWRHTPPRLQNREEIRDDLQKTIFSLKLAGADRICGYRSPDWQMTAELLEVLNSTNLLYDSSMARRESPYLLQGRDQPLVELPVSWSLDDAPYLLCTSRSFARPVSGEYLGKKWCHDLSAIAQYGGTGILTIHPWLIGRAPSFVALEMVLDYISSDSEVWTGTAVELIKNVGTADLPLVDPQRGISWWEDR